MTKRAGFPLLLALMATLVALGCGSTRTAQPLASVQSLDSDGDGVVDDRDRCPNTPGSFELLGCVDSDGDGVSDLDDQCPDAIEDLDGFEDGDGCVDDDHDHDGLPNREDECPSTPEDIDGLDDGDGCPEEDYDRDGVPDVEDLCPAEVSNCRDPARPGCGGSCRLPPAPLMFNSEEFERGAQSLRGTEKVRAEGVAQFMLSYARLAPRMRIVTHAAPNEPNPSRLARRRALQLASAFVRIGVEPGRLRLLSCSDHLPFADNTDVEGRELNRRVEFDILDGPDAAEVVERPPGACEEVPLAP